MGDGPSARTCSTRNAERRSRADSRSADAGSNLADSSGPGMPGRVVRSSARHRFPDRRRDSRIDSGDSIGVTRRTTASDPE